MALHAQKMRAMLDTDAKLADRYAAARRIAAATSKATPENEPEAAFSLSVPGLKRDIGLGDAISKLTAAVGVRPCEGCARRAAALNRALTFRAKNRGGQ